MQAICAACQPHVQFVTQDMPEDYLDWFLGWPAGFKLNDQLNPVLGYSSLAVMWGWRGMYPPSPPPPPLTPAPLNPLHLSRSSWGSRAFNWGGLAQGLGISPLLILTLCGPQRVLVVSTEPPDDLSCLTTPGVGCPGDGLLPVPFLIRCIQMLSIGGGGGLGKGLI